MHADSQEDDNGIPSKGYSLTFNTRESVLIFDLTLSHYLGSVNSNIDKNTLFGVHRSEERTNRGISCDLSRRPIQLISFCVGTPSINNNIWGFPKL